MNPFIYLANILSKPSLDMFSLACLSTLYLPSIRFDVCTSQRSIFPSFHNYLSRAYPITPDCHIKPNKLYTTILNRLFILYTLCWCLQENDFFDKLRLISRVLSSVGRALPLQGIGREFESLSTHQIEMER
jgi:hypothetical protein